MDPLLFPGDQPKKPRSDEQLAGLSLFMLPEPPSVPVSTSEAAADQLNRKRSSLDETRVLRFIASRGEQGATDDELQAHFGWDGNYERPRRWALAKQELVERSEGVKRRTRTGSLACAWLVTAKGRALLAREVAA